MQKEIQRGKLFLKIKTTANAHLHFKYIFVYILSN